MGRNLIETIYGLGDLHKYLFCFNNVYVQTSFHVYLPTHPTVQKMHSPSFDEFKPKK